MGVKKKCLHCNAVFEANKWQRFKQFCESRCQTLNTRPLKKVRRQGFWEKGKHYPLVELSKKYNISYWQLRNRLLLKWSLKEAIQIPKIISGKKQKEKYLKSFPL